MWVPISSLSARVEWLGLPGQTVRLETALGG